MRHIVNQFNEVVPVEYGRVSNDAARRRSLTDFEEELLEEIRNLKLENEELRSKLEELEG
jgi:regulator of replication initiation timing